MFRTLKLMLIGGDAKLQANLLKFLGAEGHELVLVESSEMAMNLVQGIHRPFDGVLFDMLRQPAANGFMLEPVMKLVGAKALWLLAPLGISAWTRMAEKLGILHTVHGTLHRHDLEKIVEELTVSSGNGWQPKPSVDAIEAEGQRCMIEELSNGRYFLAAGAAMKKIYATVRLLAPVDVPVLLLGESGVGKDIVASLLHRHSLRAGEAYIGVNCAALPTELLESELFGYDAGAFTGALKAKPGKFELADKGTLLLDEIGEMTAGMQAKLLHVLQDGHFSRLGSRMNTQVDVRVIAATNVNIESAIAESTFREDLYYRISAFTITIPPLRQRKEEIPYMTEEMMRRLALRHHKDPVYIPSSLMGLMQDYDWPGNLRELSNFLTRIGILQDTSLAMEDLSLKLMGRQAKMMCATSAYDGEMKTGVADMRKIVRNFKDQTESRLIQQALDASRWNRRHAAADLKISYRALLYKIQQYNLHDSGMALQARPVH